VDELVAGFTSTCVRCTQVQLDANTFLRLQY